MNQSQEDWIVKLVFAKDPLVDIGNGDVKREPADNRQDRPHIESLMSLHDNLQKIRVEYRREEETEREGEEVDPR